jgi:hypothetical protein
MYLEDLTIPGNSKRSFKIQMLLGYCLNIENAFGIKGSLDHALLMVLRPRLPREKRVNP